MIYMLKVVIYYVNVSAILQGLYHLKFLSSVKVHDYIFRASSTISRVSAIIFHAIYKSHTFLRTKTFQRDIYNKEAC